MRIAQVSSSPRKAPHAAAVRDAKAARYAELAAERARRERARTERDNTTPSPCASFFLHCSVVAMNGGVVAGGKRDAVPRARSRERNRRASVGRSRLELNVSLRRESAQKDAVQSALEVSRAVRLGDRELYTARVLITRRGRAPNASRRTARSNESGRLWTRRTDSPRGTKRWQGAPTRRRERGLRRRRQAALEPRALDLMRRLRAAEASAEIERRSRLLWPRASRAGRRPGGPRRAVERARAPRTLAMSTNRGHRDALADLLRTSARVAAALATPTRRDASDVGGDRRTLESAAGRRSTATRRRGERTKRQGFQLATRRTARSQERVKALETALEACEQCKADHAGDAVRGGGRGVRRAVAAG